MSPVRVLFFNQTAALGGAEIAMLNLVRHLDCRTIQPVVVFGAGGAAVDQMRSLAKTHVLPLPAALAEAKKDSLGVPSLFQLQKMLAGGLYIWRLARFIRQNHVDFVHTNSMKSHLLGGIAARCAQRPVLWHVRNQIDEDYLPPRVVRTFRFLARWIPHFVIACSGATLRSVYPTNSLPSGRLSGRSAVVHDGTPLAPPLNRTSKGDGLFRIGLIGRISRWKGQHVFVQAAALVHQRFPNARFFIVGSALFGETTYDEEIRSLTQRLGLSSVVTFTGFRSDVLNVITEMDLIVHASISGEPFGQVIIEGMAAKRPVIATNGGGVPEIVEDGKTGILIPMGDVQAMAEAISWIIANPDLAAEMGALGRKRVRDHFTIERTARKVEAIYKEILSGSCDQRKAGPFWNEKTEPAQLNLDRTSPSSRR